jgi:hypothetical protein
MPLRAQQERLKMRGAQARNRDEFHAGATKGSVQEYPGTFREDRLWENGGGAVQGQGGVRVAVELKDDYAVVSAQDVRLSVRIGEGETGLASVFLGGIPLSRIPALLICLICALASRARERAAGFHGALRVAVSTLRVRYVLAVTLASAVGVHVIVIRA